MKAAHQAGMDEERRRCEERFSVIDAAQTAEAAAHFKHLKAELEITKQKAEERDGEYKNNIAKTEAMCDQLLHRVKLQDDRITANDVHGSEFRNID